MTSYAMVKEPVDVFEAWAVVATRDPLGDRYVARYLTRSQAELMIEQLKAMMAAQTAVHEC
jgi:hypothetical protein